MLKLMKQLKVGAILSFHRDCDFVGILLSVVMNVAIVSSRRDMGYALTQLDQNIYRVINSLFDGIATVSETVKATISKMQKIDPDEITVIRNGVDLTGYSIKNSEPAQNNLSDKNNHCLKVACIGNIRPVKGQIYFVEAAKLITNRIPQAHFYLIGHNEGSYALKVYSRIKQLGMENAFTVTGRVDECDIPKIWSIMDLCVIPSVSEGMSNVLLEAMAAGKAVIATSVGGNPEAVVDGETGYLVPPRDPVAIAEKVNMIAHNPELRRALGARARSRVEINFSLSNMVDRYEDMLLSAYEKRNGRKCSNDDI
jgi:glycosyltransferase involved in cell wall biosynthesis